MRSSKSHVTVGVTGGADHVGLIVLCGVGQGELTVQEGGPQSLGGFIAHRHPGVVELPEIRSLEEVGAPCKKQERV